MKAIDRHFTRLINGTTQFVIPVFQRDYSWTEAQCVQLWNDIVRVGGEESTPGHFIGSVVYIPSGDTAAGFTRWLLIDGQQRLTSVTLLLIALRDHLIETHWQPAGEDDPTPKRIEAYFLKNSQEEGSRQHKLVLRRHDQEVLSALLDGQAVAMDDESRVLENYELFKERMAAVDPRVVYRGVARLIVVDVALDRGSDDPQMIFESLNSTGLDLSQADLIRNFILMRMDERNQTRLYDTYWRHIEDHFRGSPAAFDSFARDFMALHSKAVRQTRADRIYYEFRDFFRSLQQERGIDVALQEMQRHSGYYAAFVGAMPAPAPFSEQLLRLNRLAQVAAIVVMRLMDCRERCGTLTDAQLGSALALLESYVFRRAVCGMQTRGYGQFFMQLAQRITDEAPFDALVLALAAASEANRFPADDEFRTELERRDVYHTRNCHYMLDRFENFDTREPCDTGSYTIEHVLPQNERLGKKWRDMLGADWKEIQNTWVHRLGNLTLTGYNSTYSDRPFEDKKEVKGGFNESAVRLNKFIREQSQWTEKEMERRGRVLGELALKIWPSLDVSPEMLGLARRTELQREAQQYSVEQLTMSGEVRELCEHLRPLIREIDPRIIEVPRRNSVSYYADDGDFFLEILPRKWRLILLLNLSLGECVYRDEFVRDPADFKFIANAEHDAGVIYRMKDSSQSEGVLQLIRQAYELAAK
ncbi:MAG TPA: DUF262 and DUF1524 domain-containing protein [Povalibacter sp.]|uniref:DUF262 and DUF1524 domain-containing protein n=1 Tax=Povalibacter sp. TaxID=1962978 RepID=UPI002CB74D9B|nr:DUF262 and DUF1524 domain-containing protein [Povalibacter sp.]HMN45803.1 DUF262 and DUF1524 domain-containing protein [Povalibacter sp.]